MLHPPMNIPYGISDYEAIRTRNFYFVDKTRFLPHLEQHNFAVFVRPRRFGKSSWLTILAAYYDQQRADQFDTFFAGTAIGKSPTSQANQYCVLYFNFSRVRSELEHVQPSFEDHTQNRLRTCLESYPESFPPEVLSSILAAPTIHSQLNRLFDAAAKLDVKLYVLIDEYDNFANNILVHAGERAYHDLTHGDGFFRQFFTVIKGGASGLGAGISRLFMTGVSPVTLDDVTSGFNIGDNLSLSSEFDEMLGFTEPEVRGILEYYREVGYVNLEIEESLDIMREWYNGYRFSEDQSSDVFNTDMVWHFVLQCKTNPKRKTPSYLIDENVRIDYGKLRHLILANRQLNGNFDRLKTVIEEGQIVSEVVKSFPLDQLHQPQNFSSLLYYFGLLTFRGAYRGRSTLAVPNQTVQHLILGYIRDALLEVGRFEVPKDTFTDLIGDMAWEGAWEPLFRYLAEQIEAQTSIRDYLSREKVIQGFLLAYLNINDVFFCRSEYEFNKGYVDLFLEPFVAKYPDIQHGFLIELKYLKRDEWKESKADELLAEAETQLSTYLQDSRLQQWGTLRFTGVILLFCGWELKEMRAVDLIK